MITKHNNENKVNEFYRLKPKLLSSLQETLLRDCNPRPHKLIIPHYSVTADKESSGWAFATVIYVMYWPTEKEHVVNIHYRYDKYGKFLMESMRYV
jgi:hypothetical protein